MVSACLFEEERDDRLTWGLHVQLMLGHVQLVLGHVQPVLGADDGAHELHW